MAAIFLSYAHEDKSRAARVAQALEAAGHKVWWDRHIGAGSRFGVEIDAALREAELVVVLWSKSSIDSPWVHDEAAAGRDSGRLVPVLIDRVEPPLGFRQYQSIELTGGWRSIRALTPLIDAVAKRAGAPTPQSTPHSRQSSPLGIGWRIPLLAAAGVLLLAGLWFLFLLPVDPPSHIVAVAAAEGGDGARSRELARTIATDLGHYRAGPLGALNVLGANDPEASQADYRVEVGVAAAGAGLRADVTLHSRGDSQILWTTSVEGPGHALVDLRQQAVAKLGDVLACSVEVEAHSRKISREVLGLYLTGCGLMSDLNVSEPDQATLSIFRKITEKAPDFAPAWGNLALLEGQSFPGTAPPDRPALLEALKAHLARAKQLDPAYPATVVADANFHRNDGTKPAHALAILDRGLAANPDSALLHDFRAYYLFEIGRVSESVGESKRAMKLSPLSPLMRDSFISSLAYAGSTEAAFQELKAAEAIWPGSAVLGNTRYRLDLRYGDPANALRLLTARGGGDLRLRPTETAWQSFIEARMNPTPARIEKALDAFRDRYRRDPSDVPGYLQALGTFGRVDEAYRVLKPARALDSIMASTSTLFRAHMQSIRSDPRFIALAAKLGLLAYWETSNIWPDFCSEPQLPYDCQAEAAKLTPEQRKLATFFR